MNWLRQLFGQGGYSRRVDHSYERWLELNQKVCANQARRRMEAACVPFEEAVLRKYANAIHLQPFTSYVYNYGWQRLTCAGMDTDPFSEYTYWRALPCKGFIPGTDEEQKRCPKERTALGAYKARLRILMKDDSHGDGFIEQVMHYLDTRREKAAVEKAKQVAESRERLMGAAQELTAYGLMNYRREIMGVEGLDGARTFLRVQGDFGYAGAEEVKLY